MLLSFFCFILVGLCSSFRLSILLVILLASVLCVLCPFVWVYVLMRNGSFSSFDLCKDVCIVLVVPLLTSSPETTDAKIDILANSGTLCDITKVGVSSPDVRRPRQPTGGCGPLGRIMMIMMFVLYSAFLTLKVT